MPFKTTTGRRPDLEAIEVNPHIGYIGNMIYPVLNTTEKTGTFYYKTLTADAAAQTSRAAAVAPTRTLLTDSNDTFTCAEVIKRYGVVKSEVKQMGGIEAADRLGGMASKRSVQRAQEQAASDAFMTAARYAAAIDISDDPLDGILWKIDSVRRYVGRIALVFSEYSYRGLITNSKMTDRLSYSFTGLPAADILSKTVEASKMMLKGFLMVDEILIGDNDQWLVSGQEDAIGLCVLPDPDPFSHKMDAVLGKTMQYLPDGVQPYEIESHYDEDVKVNNYDCSAWYQIKEMNSAAAILMKGSTPTVTTTTTTTTTT